MGNDDLLLFDMFQSPCGDLIWGNHIQRLQGRGGQEVSVPLRGFDLGQR